MRCERELLRWWTVIMSGLGEILTLRSGPQARVSKGGHEHRACCPPFETAASRPPQGEVGHTVPGRQLPWKPAGTRLDRCAVAIGPRARSVASNTARSLRPSA